MRRKLKQKRSNIEITVILKRRSFEADAERGINVLTKLADETGKNLTFNSRGHPKAVIAFTVEMGVCSSQDLISTKY